MSAQQLESMRARAAAALSAAAAPARAEGIPAPSGDGQLIRPLAALAGVSAVGEESPAFWQGVLAVQLAHEASLQHDDVIDAAGERRGAPTTYAKQGVVAALVQGDHLLTAAYRAAAESGSLAFARMFARAVERTVAGESAQGRARGKWLEGDEYDAIATGKSGELIGCALATGSVLEGGDGAAAFALGCRLGLLYQGVDDLLDYCPQAPTGKPALGDYRQGRWTRVLDAVPGLGFECREADLLAVMRRRGAGGRSPLEAALARLEREACALEADLAGVIPRPEILVAMMASWILRAGDAVQAEMRPAPSRAGGDARREALLRLLRTRAALAGSGSRFFAANSRSFHFAARFFAPLEARRVGNVYAYCRVTDDLADQAPNGADGGALLGLWLELSERAYAGERCGIALLDDALGEMGRQGIPFDYVRELAEGMRMDLRGTRYESMEALRVYSYRVASVVGLWLARSFGVENADLLGRAERLGHAMQLTNVLRDVGEDWRIGRLYLPADRMAAHGVTADQLDAMCGGAPIPLGYRALIEELMQAAESDYRAALAVVPLLPPRFGRAVAVAAHVYRGIHTEIRRNGYDNVTRRARTSTAAKWLLAGRALWEMRRGSHGWRASLTPSRTAGPGLAIVEP